MTDLHRTTLTYTKGDNLIQRHIGAQCFGFRYKGYLIFPALDEQGDAVNDEQCTEFTIYFKSEQQLAHFQQAIAKGGTP